MDEKGLVMESIWCSLTIIDRDQKMVYKIGDGSYKMVTATKCLSDRRCSPADGYLQGAEAESRVGKAESMWCEYCSISQWMD
ncbi:hypothetical protein BDN71DRAFT_1551607 [Pleurotus eryngii]|uniref:Uncharacterized protein n=1 Tax=Pleurotus eryngii TaxID=5323 RepID=A0A9P6A0R4_PLEER|nr:hypothetical protein BDN71DRAFT_1551607 [Pleurotus eryngii]